MRIVPVELQNRRQVRQFLRRYRLQTTSNGCRLSGVMPDMLDRATFYEHSGRLWLAWMATAWWAHRRARELRLQPLS